MMKAKSKWLFLLIAIGVMQGVVPETAFYYNAFQYFLMPIVLVLGMIYVILSFSKGIEAGCLEVDSFSTIAIIFSPYSLSLVIFITSISLAWIRTMSVGVQLYMLFFLYLYALSFIAVHALQKVINIKWRKDKLSFIFYLVSLIQIMLLHMYVMRY